MVDTSNWKEFRIGDLFSSEQNGELKSVQQLSEGNIAVISSSMQEQGIIGYYTTNEPYENQLTIAHIGAGAGFCSYHNYKFNVTCNAGVLTCKHELNEYTGNFLASVITRHCMQRYDYKNVVTEGKLFAEIIKLPSTSDGKPDWQYMEDYMRKILEESEESLENLRKADNRKHLIDVSGWKRFHLYDDCMFGIDTGTKMDKAKMKEVHPTVNFVGRANANNGITTCVDKVDDIEPYPSGYMTLSLGGEYLGSCFIQPKQFYTSQNVVVLIPNANMTDNVKRFIATMIFRESRSKYKAFVDELNRHIKTDFSIILPVISTGEPDWQYMEDYMRGIMEETDARIENYSKRQMKVGGNK